MANMDGEQLNENDENGEIDRTLQNADNSAGNNEVPRPVSCTNFSIDEILKPSFGRRPTDFTVKDRFSAFTPVSSHGGANCDNVVLLGAGSYAGMKTKLPGHRPQSLSPLSSSSGPGSPGTVSSPNMSSPETEKLWPAWVYCTRYSDRPSAGPRSRKTTKKRVSEEKRPRTAFTSEQLQTLKKEFETCRYLTEQRRTQLSRDLDLSESQIKIWFQNKRAKLKKASGCKTVLARILKVHGLYNHKAMNLQSDDDDDDEEEKDANIM